MCHESVHLDSSTQSFYHRLHFCTTTLDHFPLLRSCGYYASLTNQWTVIIITLNNAHQRAMRRERFWGQTAASPIFLIFHALWTGLLTTAECFRSSLEQKWQQTRKSKYSETWSRQSNDVFCEHSGGYLVVVHGTHFLHYPQSLEWPIRQLSALLYLRLAIPSSVDNEESV